MTNVFILGAGGFGREILDFFTDLGREKDVLGFLDENSQIKGEIINNKTVYHTSQLNEYNPEDVKLVCGIGIPSKSRTKIIEKTKKMGFEYETIIHPSVMISKWVEVGEGTVICAGSILTTQIKIGNFSIINLACTVGHDVTIGNFTTLSPGTHISGNVSIGNECFFGTGSVTVQGVEIGDNSIIGAGAVISKSIPSFSLVVGVPGKVIKNLK
ncbi:MAG: acetyltransferase [Methanobrevibacter sp.]|nr:acetyltransferase [Methanobrevibacter sp.]